MPMPNLSLLSLVLVVLASMVLLYWIWRRPVSTDPVPELSSETRDAEIATKPLLTSEEAILFNLIKLVAQDQWLVLAKLPILQVISVEDRDEEARRMLMRSIQSTRLDVVLAHPGSLQTQTVVKFQHDRLDQSGLAKREALVEKVLKAAGLSVVVLHVNQTYSPEHLTRLLGLGDDE